MSHCLSSICIHICTGIRPTLLFQTILRSELQGIMTEVITVIVTNVSVILNEEHTKQPISPLLRERHVHVWHFSNEMNGVGSAVILALMRPPEGGGGAAITENWQTGGSVFASCKSDIMIVKCHFLGNKKRNNWCAQLSADGVRGTWEAGNWQMDKDPETCQ